MRRSSSVARPRVDTRGLWPQRAAISPAAEACRRAAGRRARSRYARRRQKSPRLEVSYFAYRDGALHAEGVPLERIAATFGTPCFVYSRAALEATYRAYDDALVHREHLICYAVKANSNIALLNVLARLGSGFDIVSGGELARVLAAGGDPRKTVFSGVGKTVDEMRAALAADILCFNVESENELTRLEPGCGRAGQNRAGQPARQSRRRRQHPSLYLHRPQGKQIRRRVFETRCRFIVLQPAWQICVLPASIAISARKSPKSRHLSLRCKNYWTSSTAWRQNASTLRHIDIGGGLGIKYRDETPPPVGEYIRALTGASGRPPSKK